MFLALGLSPSNNWLVYYPLKVGMRIRVPLGIPLFFYVSACGTDHSIKVVPVRGPKNEKNSLAGIA
jgi:hypothetical protein